MGSNPISLAFIFVRNFILITGTLVVGYELFGKENPLRKKRTSFEEVLFTYWSFGNGQWLASTYIEHIAAVLFSAPSTDNY